MSQRFKRNAAIVPLLWLFACAPGCGDDGLLIISFHSGIVIGDVDCGTGGGSFDLRDQQGLTIVVIITDDTDIILANGNFGTCGDIHRSNPVEVRGPEDKGTIHAQTIQLGL